jgi:branched-chain amino acid transport system substrate-binding protein
MKAQYILNIYLFTIFSFTATGETVAAAATAAAERGLFGSAAGMSATPNSNLSGPGAEYELVAAQYDTMEQKASPVAGFGHKTEAEIAKEKERRPSIAVVGPLTGELKDFGTEASNGAEMASDEFDAKGGINGKEFELVVLDTKGELVRARQAFQVLINRNSLAAVGAATGEVSFSSNKQINEAQLIMVSAGSRRRLGDTGPYNFRITLTEKNGVDSLMKYLKEEKGWKKFAIMTSVVNDYSIQLSGDFKAGIINNGLEVSHELWLWSRRTANISNDDSSISAQVGKLKANPPDALVFTGAGAEAGELVKELRKQGLNTPLVSSEDLMVPAFIGLGKGIEGTVIYSGFNPDSKRPKSKRFVRDYKKRFGREPGRLAALSYDAYCLIAEAVTKSPTLKPSHVRKALLEIKDFNGVTGTITITETGESIKEPFIMEARKVRGKYKFVGVKDPR